MKLPASFRLTDSCTFLLAPKVFLLPRRHLSAPSHPKVFFDTFSCSYSLLQMAKPADIITGWERRVRDSLSRGSGSSPVGMKLGEEMESVSS